MLVIGINTIPKFKITETVRNRIMYMMPGSYALLYVQQKNPIGSNYFVASTSSVTSICILVQVHYATPPTSTGWRRSIVVRTLVSAELSLSCARLLAG